MPGSWRGTSPRATGIPHPWTPAPYRGTGHAFDRRSDETRPQGRPTPRDWRFPLHPRSGLKPDPTARLGFVGMPVGTARPAVHLAGDKPHDYAGLPTPGLRWKAE